MKLYKFGVFIFIALISSVSNAGESVKLNDISLNRTAIALTDLTSSKNHPDYPFAKFGFRWNSGDSNTLDWRPQGITTFQLETRKWLAVTWYHRRFHQVKGVRISFVDIDPDSATYLKYRHVLMLDKDDHPLAGIHAGGLVYQKEQLFIPVGTGDIATKSADLYTFSLNNMYKVTKDKFNYFDYGYIIYQNNDFDYNETKHPEINPYHIDTKGKHLTPSFLSYDWDRDSFLIGSFGRCYETYNANESAQHFDNPECFDINHYNHRLAWYSANFTDQKIAQTNMNYFFSDMQGAAANKDNLWISSSYSRGPSHLHVMNTKNEQQQFVFNKSWCEINLPPGLEDLHISSPSESATQTVWSLTELTEKEVGGDGRVVLAFDKDNITYAQLSTATDSANVSCHTLPN